MDCSQRSEQAIIERSLYRFHIPCHILVSYYLFQEFDDYRDADDAVYELNGKELLGERWVLLILYFLYDY